MCKTRQPNLQVSIDEIINLKILFVISPRIEQRFSDLDPAHVADELEDSKNWNVDVRRVMQVGVVGREGDVEGGEGVGVQALA